MSKERDELDGVLDDMVADGLMTETTPSEPAVRYQVELGPFDSLQAAQEADSPIFARCENDYGIRIVGYDEHGDVVGVVPWGEAG